MTKTNAIEIINKKRINNSFTMGLTLEQFVINFVGRYKKVYGIELDATDYIKIAEIFIELDKDEPFSDGVEKKVLNIQI